MMRAGKMCVRLSPAAFDEDPAVVAMRPARGYPDCVRTWRDVPAARLPNVGAPVPAVITADPDVIPAGTYYAMFNNGAGRGYLNYNLGGLRQTDA